MAKDVGGRLWEFSFQRYTSLLDDVSDDCVDVIVEDSSMTSLDSCDCLDISAIVVSCDRLSFQMYGACTMFHHYRER